MTRNPATTGVSLSDIIELLTKAFALVAGATAVVVLAGGAVIYIRLYSAGVPAEDILAEVPKELLISTGLVEVVLPTLLTVALFFAVLPHSGNVLRYAAALYEIFVHRQSPQTVRGEPRMLGDSRSQSAAVESLPDATRRAVVSLQGLLGVVGFALLPIPLHQVDWRQSAAMAGVIAAALAIAFTFWTGYGASRANHRDRKSSTVDGAISVAPLTILWGVGVWALSLPRPVIASGLLAAFSASGFVFGATIIQAKFATRPWSLGALASTTALASITIAWWFLWYVQERPLLPARVCMKSQPAHYVHGSFVGQSSSRIYLAVEADHALASYPLDDTTSVQVHGDKKGHWIGCRAAPASGGASGQASGTP